MTQEAIQHNFSTTARRREKATPQAQETMLGASTRYKDSGEGGIRTRGGVTPTQHFQCCTFGRSVTSPGLSPKYTGPNAERGVGDA